MEIKMPMYVSAQNKPLQDFLRCHLLIDDRNRVLIPKNYDKVNCVGLFHKKSCSIRVVKKTNPDISCKVYNGAG
ncbi:beta-microseminoprotein-like [Grus japonensis]|uniref:Beta-microseminoprotein-like, partial n=1 Tax=Grus japonensis TaxID=30415 RepID=A0ABC9X3I0_GRUJA